MFFCGQIKASHKACGNYFTNLLKYFELITQNMQEKNRKLLSFEKSKPSSQQYTVIYFGVAFLSQPI